MGNARRQPGRPGPGVIFRSSTSSLMGHLLLLNLNPPVGESPGFFMAAFLWNKATQLILVITRSDVLAGAEY